MLIVDYAAFHEVDCVIEFQIAIVEMFPVQSQNVAHDIFGEDALIFQVVNRVDCLDFFVAFVALMFQFQQNRYQSRVPVVGIDYVRDKSKRGKSSMAARTNSVPCRR